MGGLAGFAEKGEPTDWDTALGSVRGFRMWYLRFFFERIDPCPVTRYFPVPSSSLTPYDDELPPPNYTAVPPGQGWLPRIDASVVTGLHNAPWNKRLVDTQGRYRASCDTWPPLTHNVPAPDCGCGFWAYWDGLPDDECRSRCVATSTGSDSEKLAVGVPLNGIIEGSGRVIIGEKGFRSEYARITDLSIELRSLYKIPYDDSCSALSHITEVTKLSAEATMWAITTAVTASLGSNYKTWESAEELCGGAERDGNYVK